MANRGRPRKIGKPRKAGGRIKNSAVDPKHVTEAVAKALEERLALEAGTWRRRRQALQDGEILTIDEARLQERGSVLHNWLKVSEDRKRKGHEQDALISRDQFDALISFEELHQKQRALHTKVVKSSSDFDRVGGHDNTDPFGDLGRRHANIHKDYKAARTAILEASSLAMFAVETIVFENKEVYNLVGDLRLAANALNNLKKHVKAA